MSNATERFLNDSEAAHDAMEKAFTGAYKIGHEDGEWAVTRVGVAVVIINGKQILLGKRICPGKSGDGTYQFAGGKVDWGEAPETTCIRETLEETGAGISDPKLIASSSEILDNGKKHFITLYYYATYEGGLVLNADTGMYSPPNEVEQSKCEGWQWYDYDNLPKPLWTVAQHVEEAIKSIVPLVIHLPR